MHDIGEMAVTCKSILHVLIMAILFLYEHCFTSIIPCDFKMHQIRKHTAANKEEVTMSESKVSLTSCD